jgi:hypothetical protein
MKNLIAFIIPVLAISFIACNTSNTEGSLLKNEAQRKALFSEILANKDYTNQSIDSIITRDHVRQMMAQDKGMMHMMMTESDIVKIMGDTAAHTMMMHNMMRLMEKDSVVWVNMCEKMMKNKVPNKVKLK